MPLTPSTAERDRLFDQHPLRLDSYCIPTPRLQAVYELIRERVWMRHTGLVFRGTPRLGKSFCAREVRALLQADFPQAKILLLVTPGKALRPKEERLPGLLFAAADLLISRKLGAADGVKAFATSIEQALAPNRGSQFVLLIDEMQNLNPTDFDQLVAVHNALDDRGIQMTTIGFAQDEILNWASSFRATAQHQIIGRFLSDTHPFLGCTSESELRTILQFFDCGSAFPTGSGWTYTAFFVPQAFAHGLRLEAVSAALWTALSKAVQGREAYGVPMNHLCLSVKYLLLTLCDDDTALLQITDQSIVDAVQASGLQAFVGEQGVPLNPC
jgi:hypothetical protein